MKVADKLIRNILFGFFSQILTIILGIIVPRLIITSYGSEINGLISSITEIYAYFGLLEAGVGAATIQALYRTIGSGNRNSTNAVLSATNKYYQKTGFYYLSAVCIFAFLYPLLIKSEIPNQTIVLIVIFNGLGDVINYFFQGKYSLLLQAEGKSYVITALNMATNLLKNCAKIILINSGFGVVFVQLIAMIVSVVQMLFLKWYIYKYYAWIDLKVMPDFQSISQSKNVLVHNVTGLIFNNTDNIMLTVFCGLKVVSVYSMYAMVFSMVRTAQATLNSSPLFLLGQTFHADKKRFEQLYECYELYYITIVFAMYSIANYFILPFIKLYTVGVTDIEYMDKFLPHLFILIYLLSCGRNASNNVITFAGHFKQTQNRAIIEAAINLVVSFIAVNFLGIYGVLIGTIIALLYRTNDIIIYANRKILQRSCWKTYKRWIINMLVYCLLQFVNRYIYVDLSSYRKIVIIFFPYAIITAFIFLFVSSITDIATYKCMKGILRTHFKVV